MLYYMSASNRNVVAYSWYVCWLQIYQILPISLIFLFVICVPCPRSYCSLCHINLYILLLLLLLLLRLLLLEWRNWGLHKIYFLHEFMPSVLPRSSIPPGILEVCLYSNWFIFVFSDHIFCHYNWNGFSPLLTVRWSAISWSWENESEVWSSRWHWMLRRSNIHEHKGISVHQVWNRLLTQLLCSYC